MWKNNLVILVLLTCIQNSYGQDFPADLSGVKIPKPEEIMFEEHIDFSKVKSMVTLINRNTNVQDFDTLYIKHYNQDGWLEKEINFSNNQRWNITTNTYSDGKLVKGTWHNLTKNSRTELNYNYNTDDQLTNFNRKEISLKDNKVLDEHNMIVHYENGKPIETTKKIAYSSLSGNYKTKYRYSDSLLIETKSINGKTKINNSSRFEYDELGRVVQRSSYIESEYYKVPHLQARSSYTYNSRGLLILDSLVLYDSKMTKVTRFKYDQNERLVWMKEHIQKKGKDNYLESHFKYENEKLIAINSVRVKNLDYVTWRIPICRKLEKKSIGKPKNANIIYTYDEKSSRIGTEYTLEDDSGCSQWKHIIEYRN
ncbi:hypothetical protein [Winogradskyella sp.]|uniref:hypothetical protein n=1 Tax=Winogradskyella sp. TaxID=1883156 RepID=UPI003BAAB99D